jgi:hypothetical protein
MKRLILTGLAALAIVTAALGRTDPSYINNTIQIFPPGVPPMIDATNFINNSAFIDNTFNSLFVSPYETANTVNYTNFGVLGAVEGFQFDTFNTQTARHTSAGNFYNAVGAIVNCGGTNDGPYFTTNAAFFSIGGEAECLVWATNIINRGTIEMGIDSLLSLQGQNVNLSGGLLTMEGFESGNIFGIVGNLFGNGGIVFGSAGMFDGYWGLGQTRNYNVAGSFGAFFASSPLFWVTNREYTDMQTAVSSFSGATYLNAITNAADTNGIDVLWQVVYVQNANPTISNNVYFAGAPVVEWLWPSTNIVTGVTSTNHLFFEDGMILYTNLMLMTNGVAPPNTGYGWTYMPTNYFFEEAGFFFGTLPATSAPVPDIFTPNDKEISTEYTAYEVIFEPTTVIPGEVAGQTYSNMPGRIEITADKQLDLSSSRISGLNYLRLTATNNFTSDSKTRILTEVADYNLGVTNGTLNGTLTVSNLLAPTCPRLYGLVDVFSTRWTNTSGPFTNISVSGTNVVTNIFNITNTYFVTVVNSQLASSSPSLLQNLTLHATMNASNVVISDVLNVLSNITIDAYNVTITTNGPGAQTPAGQLNFPSGNPLTTSAFPRLRTLTNYGVISVLNAASFGAPAQPLWDFVNYGRVQAQGCSIWATNFENTGLVDAGPGPINLTANTAVLSNGVFNAPFNDIILSCGSLLISNQVLNSGHNLTIWATNSLSDGGPASGNFWSAGVLGFSLPILPSIASLLGTTITNTAPAYAAVSSQWAGQDLGPVAAGYSNNAALGRLILDGGLNSSFAFAAPTGANALYVDYLEFRNFLTNFDGSGDLANLSFGSGMKIYYAQLIINGVSFAEKLNHKNGGGLNWVAAYAGAFSSTNMVYPDGTTNRLNLALVQSCDLDSNGNGIANCQDPAPVFVPSEMNLTAVFTNTSSTTVSSNAVVLSWNSIPFATNSVFFEPSVTATNWQLLTNFVTGPAGGRQRVVDPVGASGKFYRVRVDLAAP